MSYNTATETTFTFSRACDSCVYQVPGSRCSFVYGMGLQPAGIIHNNLAGDTSNLLFFCVQPTNQPTRKGVGCCHKKVGRPWFTETRVIQYQPFVSVHNNRFHSKCYTNDMAATNTCENNIILILVKEMACLGKKGVF